MTISLPLDGSGIQQKPWVLPAVAGVVLAAVVATAGVCIFAISLPILPVLAVCSPVAVALIVFIVWRILNPKVTPGTNAEIENQKSSDETPEETAANGEGNGLEGPIPDVEDIANDDQGFNPLAIKALKFLGSRDGKFLFNGLDADNSSFSFAAESFDVALGECRNVEHLTFDGSVPEGLVIKAEVARELEIIKFTNTPNITEFRALNIFDGFPQNLGAVIVENCSGLTSATVIPLLETHFENCNRLRTIYVGDGPHKPEFTESDSLVVCEIPPSCDGYKTLISVCNCSSFNPVPNGEKRIREFDSVENIVTMLSNGAFSFYARHCYGVRNGAADVTFSWKMDSATEIPPAYDTVDTAKILSEPEKSGEGVLFRLPGNLSVREVDIDYRTEAATIGKCILDFNQPKRIILNSEPVAHVVLTNRQKSGSKEVTSCIVTYNPANDSTVEIENFTYLGNAYCVFRNDGSEGVNLPKIRINGLDLEVVWYKENNSLYPICKEQWETFSRSNPDRKFDDTGKWGAGEFVAVPASWTLLE